jgi:hypothetical protein
MNILQQFKTNDGLELLIDLQTGEVFASQRGLARICDKPESTVRLFVGAHKLIVNKAQIQTPSGIQGAQVINEEGIKKAIIKYRPELLEKLIDCGLRIYLHGLAGYKYEIASPPQLSPYLIRLDQFNEQKIPKGYWCIFGETANLLKQISRQYPVGVYDLVDGSVGLCWSNYRKGKEWCEERIQYPHHFPDHRGVQNAWCYGHGELPYFRKWYEDIYEPKQLPKYLQKKYGELAKV